MIMGGETVTVIRKGYGSEDDYGNPVETTHQFDIENVLVAFGSTASIFDLEGTFISSAATLYLPSGTHVEDADEFIVRGKQYRKDGEPQEWNTPPGFSLNTGVVVALRRTGG